MLNMLHFVRSVAHASFCGTTAHGLGYPRRTPVLLPQRPPAGCSGGALPRVLWHSVYVLYAWRGMPQFLKDGRLSCGVQCLVKHRQDITDQAQAAGDGRR